VPSPFPVTALISGQRPLTQPETRPLFSFETYHVVLAALGVIIIAARWLPRLVSNREPASAPLMIIFGVIAGIIIAPLPEFADPRSNPLPWEVVSELTVIIALFGAGMRIDKLGPISKWGPTARLLGISMPITIAAVALLGVWAGGLTIAGAILLGAVLAPTDPVLAADVQVGPPQEGAEHPVRFTLTTEAALNDGLAFPFVYLGLLVAAEGFSPGIWGLQWVGVDVVYRIFMGALMGWGGGKLLGILLFSFPRRSAVADTSSGVISLAGVLLCYGSTEMVHGYGFIAVAVMGLTLRRQEADHAFHRRLHDFSESLEHALTAVLLVALGVVLPLLFQDLQWSHVLIALVLIFGIRPLAGALGLARANFSRNDCMVTAFYGVRGIGSIYYLCYAGRHMEFINEGQLWSLVGLTILLSTMFHGFSVGWAMDKVSDEKV